MYFYIFESFLQWFHDIHEKVRDTYLLEIHDFQEVYAWKVLLRLQKLHRPQFDRNKKIEKEK